LKTEHFAKKRLSARIREKYRRVLRSECRNFN